MTDRVIDLTVEQLTDLVAGAVDAAMKSSVRPSTLGLEDVAELLGVSRRTVQRRIADGVIEAVDVGGTVRCPRTQFEQ